MSGWNWAVVGQGIGPVEKTAMSHELAHIFANNWHNTYMSETESHMLFAKVDI